MELRSCRSEERADAIRLARQVFKDNMGEQFPVLFGEANIGRMFIAVENGTVVSMVNHHTTPVRIGDAEILVASVGAVCTDPAFRGQKIASRLLRLAEAKMREEGVHVIVISGEGGIYTEFGSGFAGDMREALVPGTDLDRIGNVTLKCYEDSLFSAVERVHRGEPVRFVRRPDEFRMLIRGQTYPDTFATYPFETILADGVIVAYAILVLGKEEPELGIKEFAGARDAIAAAFPLLLEKYGRSAIHFACAPDDRLLGFVPEACVKPIHQFASLKIIDFAGLMERLAPYFRTLVGDRLTTCSFTTDAGDAVIRDQEESIRIVDSKELVKIVFGCAGAYPANASPRLAATLTRIFPVPLPWTHSINYQ